MSLTAFLDNKFFRILNIEFLEVRFMFNAYYFIVSESPVRDSWVRDIPGHGEATNIDVTRCARSCVNVCVHTLNR